MQYPTPDDFIIATGENHTIEEFVTETFNYLGLNWKDYVEQDKNFMRPAETTTLLGDYSKAKKLLGYEPKVKFQELIKIMVDNENLLYR